MHVSRGGKSQQVLQINLARRRIQQIGAAHDMRDALEYIVDDYCQLICKQAIRAFHHEIANFGFEVLADAALQSIFKLDTPSPLQGEGWGGGRSGDLMLF